MEKVKKAKGRTKKVKIKCSQQGCETFAVSELGLCMAHMSKEQKLEYKRNNFVRLAKKRMTRIAKYFESIVSLSNGGNYDYTGEQVTKIIETLAQNVRMVADAFASKQTNNGDFNF